MEPLTIKNWELGIGDSPYTGFAQMVNVDIYSQPGSVKISNKLIPDGNSNEIVDRMIKWIVQEPVEGDVYAVDENGKLYKRVTGGGGTWSVITGHGTTGAAGQGLGIWNDYLFYAREEKLDVYGPLSSSPAWENNWQDLESSSLTDLHPIMAAQDGHLYIGSSQYVDTVIQTLGDLIVNPSSLPFDPTDPTTYTWDDPRLTLDSKYEVVCLEDQATNVAIGTHCGANELINIADIFFWDGASDSFQRGSTIHLVENGVQMMKNDNNVLNIIAGTGRPRVFQAVTSQSVEKKRLNNVVIPFGFQLDLYPGATDLINGEVLFGIGNGFGSGTGVVPMGVYSFRGNAYVLRYRPNPNEDGDMRIGAVKVISPDEILVSYKYNDSDSFGVDILTENLYTEYLSYVESPLYTIGTEDDPKTFEKVQVTMGRKLNEGDGVRIKARYSLDDTWVTIAEFTSTNYLGKSTFDTKVGSLSKFKDFQTRIELTTASDSTISPELKEVTFT